MTVREGNAAGLLLLLLPAGPWIVVGNVEFGF